MRNLVLTSRSTTHGHGAAVLPMRNHVEACDPVDRLAAELRALGPRLIAARSLLATAGPGLAIAQAHYEQLRTRHARLLAQLRSYRCEARGHGLAENSVA